METKEARFEDFHRFYTGRNIDPRRFLSVFTVSSVVKHFCYKSCLSCQKVRIRVNPRNPWFALNQL